MTDRVMDEIGGYGMLERISAGMNPRNPRWRKAAHKVRRRKHAIACDLVPPLLPRPFGGRQETGGRGQCLILDQK